MENIILKTTLSIEPISLVLEGERDSTKSGIFTITNTGTEDFHCQNISKSCGCTLPEGLQAGDIIKSGESKDINFTIKLSTPGTKYIYLFGNLEENISLPIHLNLI